VGSRRGHLLSFSGLNTASDLFFSIASVAGTAEPVYNDAFQSVITRVGDKNPVSDLTPEDYEWTLPDVSHVETSTFYITAETGHAVTCQIIHSKVKYVPSFIPPLFILALVY